MRHSMTITILSVMLLTMTSQSAFAQSELIRSEKPVSVMLELSAGGPNGTVGTHLDYDFVDWAGVSVGVGYSGFSKSVNTSLMFNTRLFRGGSAHHEGSLQLSLGVSYRGQSEREEQSLWGDETSIYKADHTLFVSSSVGYALAHKGGLRFHTYLGWDFPVHVENYHRLHQHGDDDAVAVDESKALGAGKSLNAFWPSIGVSFGYSF